MQPEVRNILLRMVLWIIHLWVRLPIHRSLLRHIHVVVRHKVHLVPVSRGRQLCLVPPPLLPRRPRRDRKQLRKPRLAGNQIFLPTRGAEGRAAAAAVHHESLPSEPIGSKGLTPWCCAPTTCAYVGLTNYKTKLPACTAEHAVQTFKGSLADLINSMRAKVGLTANSQVGMHVNSESGTLLASLEARILCIRPTQ